MDLVSVIGELESLRGVLSSRQSLLKMEGPLRSILAATQLSDTPEQHRLIEGAATPGWEATTDANSADGWVRLPDGSYGFVRRHGEDADDHLKSAMFLKLARMVGMGDYVPTSAFFVHPDGQPRMLTQVKQGSVFDPEDYGDHAVLEMLSRTGVLDRLLSLDLLGGVSDRHDGTYSLSATHPHVTLTDNSSAFGIPNAPSYANAFADKKGLPLAATKMSPLASSWLSSLRPVDVEGACSRLQGNGAARRLMAMQALARAFGPELSRQDLVDAAVKA